MLPAVPLHSAPGAQRSHTDSCTYRTAARMGLTGGPREAAPVPQPITPSQASHLPGHWGSQGSRRSTAVRLWFLLREYQKRSWNGARDFAFSAAATAEDSYKVILSLWSKPSLALWNEMYLGSQMSKHLRSAFIAISSALHWALIPKQFSVLT